MSRHSAQTFPGYQADVWVEQQTGRYMMSSDFSQRRVIMVDGQIRTRDVTSSSVLDAFLDIPREIFVPESRRDMSYMDEDIAVQDAHGGQPARYLMAPAILAKLLQLAEIRVSDLVLDIGCATGYSTAILSRLSSFVVGVESEAALAHAASANLEAISCVNTTVVTAALDGGYAKQAPFDVIVLQGSVDVVPGALLAQLGDGGRLVAVIGQGLSARAELFVKNGSVVSSRSAFNAALRPLPGFSKIVEFTF